MSDKPWMKLSDIDRMLRRAYPPGPGNEGTQVTVKKVCGFELHNSRPYHNYETWSDGYVVSDGEITVRAEDLDDAVRILVTCRSEGHEQGSMIHRPYCPRCRTFLDEAVMSGE